MDLREISGILIFTFLLASDENAYSTSCEIVGEVKGSINEIALHDFKIFKELFDYDFSAMEKSLDAECLQVILDYQKCNVGGRFLTAGYGIGSAL